VGSALTSAAGLGAFPLAVGELATTNLVVPPSEASLSGEPSENVKAEIANQIRSQSLELTTPKKRMTPAEQDLAEKKIQNAIDAAIQAERVKTAQRKVDVHGSEQAIIKMFDAIKESAQPYDYLEGDLDEAKNIRKNLAYSYLDDSSARNAMQSIRHSSILIVGRPLPDGKTISSLKTQRDAVVQRIDALEKKYHGIPEVDAFVQTARKKLGGVNELIKKNEAPRVVALVAYVTDTQAKVQKIFDFVNDWFAQDNGLLSQRDASIQVLPIALYPESKVAVTVKCSDAVTTNALFDNIQFNAYFQNPPIFDISAGVLISTLHGRQVTTQVPYVSPSTPASCPANPDATPPTSTSDCAVVVIKRTRPQFMPGVFAELHPWNFKLPWAKDPARVTGNPPQRVPTWMSDDVFRHPWGYVGSVGFAGGFLVNLNNGTTQAEFFEGISLGIQRFAFMIGNHNGRSQNLTNGYYEGAPVTSGTTPTTVSNWANGLAFGITYRIPLR
jgi:hypothetical protein